MGERERQSRLALNARLIAQPVFDGGCRDPRWASPTTARLEAAWDNANPPWTNYIPNLGTPSHYAAIDQIEEHVKRPITSDGWRIARKLEDRPRVAAPPAHRKKVSPTIFTNSMAWNRRHYEPTVTQHPWKAARRVSWYSPRSARSSHSGRRRLKPDSAGGPGFAGLGSGLVPSTKRNDSPIPEPPPGDATPAPESLQPEPELETKTESAPRRQLDGPLPDSIIAFKAASHSMKPYRKGWILHKQHDHADSANQAIESLQEQMMDKIRCGCVTQEELEEFKKMIAELSSSMEG